ncbi:MAG: sterol desaturase family protein [Methylococcaceae bacterium]|nr:sterol desaturase family protein [Methylococcaceae bacterium]
MESLIRIGFSVGIFTLMVVLENYRPKRKLTQKRLKHWTINIGLGLFNNLLLRVTLGGLAIQSALIAQENHWGLINNFFSTGHWATLLLGYLLLDFAIYLQHIASHKWRWLWRFHCVHHSDLEIDASTAVRFHPGEIIISMLYKSLCIFLIGPSAFTVFIFEIILNGCALFNHSNIAIPTAIESRLRHIMITPDLHRIHHSMKRVETDSNYGFSICWWDKLCQTYTAKVAQPLAHLPLGLPQIRAVEKLSWFYLLALPFRRQQPRD